MSTSNVRTADMLRNMFDLSTAHMTEHDDFLLRSASDEFPRTIPHSNGAIVFVSADDIDGAVSELTKRGHSEAFIAIYKLAALRGDILLVNFDGDADAVFNLPTFEW